MGSEATACPARCPDELRIVIVVGFIDQMIEFREAVVPLIRGGKVGSAFPVGRSIVESMCLSALTFAPMPER